MEPIQDLLNAKEKNSNWTRTILWCRRVVPQVPNFILKHPDLSLGAKVTYAMFLSHAWNNNYCFPGQDRLAKDIGMSRSRVTEFITELEAAKLITITRRGQGKTNLYKVHFRVVPKRKKPVLTAKK
jgi:hypothetical protein